MPPASRQTCSFLLYLLPVFRFSRVPPQLPEHRLSTDTNWKWSEKTDVWAFGVVLWEIFSDGEEPYTRELGPDAGNRDILKFILEKNHLSKPENCPYRIYEVMKGCWSFEPEDRPTFKCLQSCLQDLELVCSNNPAGIFPCSPMVFRLSQTLKPKH